MQTSWKAGMNLIQKGLDYQEQKKLELAAQCLETGIQSCITALKKLPDSKSKNQKREQIKIYMDVLEKVRLEQKHYNDNYQPPKKMKKSKKDEPDAKSNDPKGAYLMGKKLTKQEIVLMERIHNEILTVDTGVTFSDVIGLEAVKQALTESVILPQQRPDLFTGPRAPPPGILLFGPPGNGKTYIAKALASECKCTFFNVSASVLTSKYVGEGEKLVKALFQIANLRAPSIIFIDEVDSLLTMRGGDKEQESSRKMKTEFLIQLDGVGSLNTETKRILLIGATNLPWELDDAILRRFPKRIMVSLPGNDGRKHIIKQILNNKKNKLNHNLTNNQINSIVDKTNGYSSSDLKYLINDACMGPIRDMGSDKILQCKDVPPITYQHFLEAIESIKPTSNQKALKKFVEWNDDYGSTIKIKKKHKNQIDKKMVVNENKTSWFSVW